jgi:hypothetical protein
MVEHIFGLFECEGYVEIFKETSLTLDPEL